MGRNVHHSQQCFQLKYRGTRALYWGLCAVFVSVNSLDPIWPSTELLVPGIVHVPPLWLVFLWQLLPWTPRTGAGLNSFLPSGVLSWLLNFLNIPFQITSFFLVFPSVHHHQLPKAPGTFYSVIFQQTCLLNLCHSVEVILSCMLKNTWYCSTNNTIQTQRHPSLVSKSYSGSQNCSMLFLKKKSMCKAKIYFSSSLLHIPGSLLCNSRVMGFLAKLGISVGI